MTTPVWRQILRGIKSIFARPPVGTGGTVSAKYCYSVYLRHLVIANLHGLATDPLSVVELGPGDSIGIGLMALLTGAEQYQAVDAVRHASKEANLLIFDELVKLLMTQAPIPCGADFAEILPKLDDYAFPRKILSPARLTQSLKPERLRRLRLALEADLLTGPIRYLAPMGRMYEIPNSSVDLIISQAVMEHVDELEDTYRECFRCLKPNGFMSHQIDFKSHDTAPEWNGHWKYADLTWRLMRGGRPWFINRKPFSAHVGLIRRAGFNIHAYIKQSNDLGISQAQLAHRFKDMSECDLRTSSALILVSK